MSITSLTLTSTSTQAHAPFQFGVGFKQGDATDIVTDLPEYQVIPKRYWNDGSLKLAAICGHTPLTANVPLTVNISSGVSPTGTNLTSAEITAAASTASVQCGAFGTVSLATLLASPTHTWISGPEMVECRYRSVVAADTNLVVKFDVKLFKRGAMFVRCIVDSGYLGVAEARKTYVPTVIIGGVTVYTLPQRTITNIVQTFHAGDGNYDETITSANHGFVKGSQVLIAGVNGMTQINGFRGIASATTNTFTTVRQGSAYSAYTSGGTADFVHSEHCRWFAEGWIGTDPAITPQHDTTYLISTKLVPNYWKFNPSAGTLNAMTQTYTPHGIGDIEQGMGSTGFQPQIGILPRWDALFCNSGGDARAYRSVLANAKHTGSYAMVWTDPATGKPTRPSDKPTWTFYGAGAGGGTPDDFSTTPNTYDGAHHHSAGYLAYILTGDYCYLEIMMDWSSVPFLSMDSGNGSGTSRAMLSQTRMVGWVGRTFGQLAAIGPTTDTVVTNYQSLLDYNVTRWLGISQTPGICQTGWIYCYELTGPGAWHPSGEVGNWGPPWMFNYWIQSYGHIQDLECLSSMTNLIALNLWIYRAVVGMLGTNGGYCYTRAGEYGIRISAAVTNTNPTSWHQTWADIQLATFGVAAGTCADGGTLQGASGSDPAHATGGYWGYMLPALAFAVDHGATGADAAWARLQTASNFSTIETAGFANEPIFGIVPRVAAAITSGEPLPKGRRLVFL